MSIPIWVTDPAGNNNPFLKIKSPFFIGVGHAAAVATWSQSGSPWIPLASPHAFIWTAEMVEVSPGVYSAVTWTNNTVLPAAMSAVVTLRNAGNVGDTYFASMSAVSDGVFHLASSSDGITYSTIASTDGIYDIASGLF